MKIYMYVSEEQFTKQKYPPLSLVNLLTFYGSKKCLPTVWSNIFVPLLFRKGKKKFNTTLLLKCILLFWIFLEGTARFCGTCTPKIGNHLALLEFNTHRCVSFTINHGDFLSPEINSKVYLWTSASLTKYSSIAKYRLN